MKMNRSYCRPVFNTYNLLFNMGIALKSIQKDFACITSVILPAIGQCYYPPTVDGLPSMIVVYLKPFTVFLPEMRFG